MKKKTISIIFIFIIIFTVVISFLYQFTQKADINYYQGYRLFLKGHYRQAIPFYETAIKNGSQRRETFRELAYCYLWTGKSDKSIKLFEELNDKDPDDLKVKGSLAEAYSWNRDFSKAIKIFEEIISRTDSLWAKEKLAEVYIWSGQNNEAKIFLEPLVKKYPDNYNLKLMWGKALYYSGDSEKASGVFEELMKEENEES